MIYLILYFIGGLYMVSLTYIPVYADLVSDLNRKERALLRVLLFSAYPIGILGVYIRKLYRGLTK